MENYLNNFPTSTLTFPRSVKRSCSTPSAISVELSLWQCNRVNYLIYKESFPRGMLQWTAKLIDMNLSYGIVWFHKHNIKNLKLFTLYLPCEICSYLVRIQHYVENSLVRKIFMILESYRQAFPIPTMVVIFSTKFDGKIIFLLVHYCNSERDRSRSSNFVLGKWFVDSEW